MIPDDHALMLFKFGEYKWIKQIQDGWISFACPGRYIDSAKRTGNDEQGDLDEGIFARLKKNDSRIREYSEKLRGDIEIINDGEYVKLRRKSTYYIPTFCFYTIKAADLLKYENIKLGTQRIPFHPDDRMFNYFSSCGQLSNVLSNDYVYSQLVIKPAPFKYSLMEHLIINGYDFKMGSINYKEFEKEEFFIEPTNKREELFYKFPRFSYQQEARVCLYNSKLYDIYDRLNIRIRKLLDKDMMLIRGITWYCKMTATIVEKN